jgi:hypothetical protein
MKIFRHKSHIVYELCKKLVIVRELEKVQFWFPTAYRPKGAKNGFVNVRFYVRPHKQFRYFHWFIRLPFLYWEKGNGGFKFGLPSLYLWKIR